MTYRRVHFHRHQYKEDTEMHHIHHHYHSESSPEVLARLDAIYTRLDQLERNIMAAIDDLKTSIAALIAEATTDITTLVNSTASNSSDPAIQQLATDVQTATKNLHDQFTAATGTPVPPTT